MYTPVVLTFSRYTSHENGNVWPKRALTEEGWRSTFPSSCVLNSHLLPRDDAHEVREHTRADDRAEQTDVVRVSIMARAGLSMAPRPLPPSPPPTKPMPSSKSQNCRPHVRHEFQRVVRQEVDPAELPPATVSSLASRAFPPLERANERHVVASRVRGERAPRRVRLVFLLERKHERIFVRHPRRDGQRRAQAPQRRRHHQHLPHARIHGKRGEMFAQRREAFVSVERADVRQQRERISHASFLRRFERLATNAAAEPRPRDFIVRHSSSSGVRRSSGAAWSAMAACCARV